MMDFQDVSLGLKYGGILGIWPLNFNPYLTKLLSKSPRSIPKTNKLPENRERRSSSKHHLVGAFAVSFREDI